MVNWARRVEGYRVLEFTQLVAGPTCSRLLAEMGAEVLKLELAPAGDRVRTMGLKPRRPEGKASSHSTYYMQHDHSKLRFALDMQRPGSRELVRSMFPKFGVLVQNFAPGVIKRLVFSYETLMRVHAKIIMCAISTA